MGEDESARAAEATVDRPDSADVETLTDLWVELAADQRAYGSHIWSEENRGPIRDAMARHVITDGVRVARLDGAVVGFVMYGLERGDYAQDVSRGIVRNIYVAPDHRGGGLGSELLRAAEEELAGAGADVVALEAMAANDEARRFYDRHDYDVHRIELEKAVESDTHSKED
jgi:ribosomal protein S18 acetylase RimI-like enzyme